MSGPHRIAYQPALDGVRALAVIAVLLFHAGTPGFSGGYLGVSVFFTLSGYLITSLLVREHETTGRIDLRAFYGRRMRRLLPASVVTVAVVVVIAALSDVFDGVADLRAQVIGALFQVSNWVLLAGDGSYQELLAQASGAVSPLEHFWSLAIEEQFYWLWPPVMLLVLARCADHRARVVVIGAATAATMVAAPLIAQVWGPDAAYWATPARLSEILVGAFLALVLTRRTLSAPVAWFAPAALALLAVFVVTFPAAGGPAYNGWLPVVAVVSGSLVLGLQVAGPVRSALSMAPLVGIGKISYGVYLFHWPIFVIVDADRTGIDGPPLTVIRLAITFAIAVASYYVLEQPIRRARGIPFGRVLGGSLAATGAVAVVALVVVPTGLGTYWRADDAAVEAAAIQIDDAPLTAQPEAPTTSSPASPATTAPSAGATAATSPATTSPPTTSPASSGSSATSTAPPTTEPVPSTLPPLPDLERPLRIVVTGDSTADALGTGVVTWAAANPDLAQVEVQAAPGCGFVMGGERRYGDTTEPTDGCDGWVESQLFPVVERTQPDVVVVMVTTWDLIDRRWDDGELLDPTDPEFSDRLEFTYTQLADELVAVGAGRVAFVREPVPDAGWWDKVDNEDEPFRHEALYALYDDLATSRSDTVSVVDLAGWFTDAGFDRDKEVRPDGIHLTPEAATAITAEFLGDRFIRAGLGWDTR